MNKVPVNFRFFVFLATLLIIRMTIALADRKDDWPVPEEARKLTNPVPANETTLAAAKSIYLDKCANCHGESGDGQGPEASLYSVQPRDFRDAARMHGMTDGELFWKMSTGRRPMPAFKKQLTEEQRWELVHYIRTFVKKPAPVTPKKQ